MTNVDQFASMFRSATREVFQHERIEFQSVLVVTDLDVDEARAFGDQTRQFLRIIGTDAKVQWHDVGRSDFRSAGELLDGTEADTGIAGCPDPVNPDSDGDTLSDGEEVLTLGTDPCKADTDGDGIPDNFDPLPLDPEGTSGVLEDQTRDLAAFISGVDLARFTGPNANANSGRRNALSNRARAAANEISHDNFAEAISILENLRSRVDGVEPPPDWIAASTERDEIAIRASQVIAVLQFLVP